VDRIGYGIVGVGSISLRAHIPALSMMDDVDIVALCNPSRGKLEQGAALCRRVPTMLEDYRDLIAMPDVDVVVVASPNDTHREITLAALAAGKHVLCEKPMATTLDDCLAVRQAAEGYGHILQYGLELRYAELYRRMAQIIQEGQIGRLRMLFCKEFRGPMLPGSGGWRSDRSRSGGVLLEKNCHHFDLFNWFAQSEPVRVAAMGGSDVLQDGQVDNAWVTVEYANGVRACLGVCLFSPFGNDLEVSAVGDRGKLESFTFHQTIRQWGTTKPDETVCRVAFDPLFSDICQEQREKERAILWERSLIYREHRDLIDCVRTGRRPLVDAEVSLKSCVVALAAHQALETGSVVPL